MASELEQRWAVRVAWRGPGAPTVRFVVVAAETASEAAAKVTNRCFGSYFWVEGQIRTSRRKAGVYTPSWRKAKGGPSDA